jgi:hypothetical protein
VDKYDVSGENIRVFILASNDAKPTGGTLSLTRFELLAGLSALAQLLCLER